MNVSTLGNGYLRQHGALKQLEDMDVLVGNALRLVVENVFANQSNTFIFTISVSPGLAVDGIIKTFLALTSFIAVQLIVLNNKTKHTAEALSSRRCHIIVIDSQQSLVDANIVQYNNNSNGLEYYFMFLKSHESKINHEMELIFRYCYDNYWLNCNVMVQSKTGDILVYTYFPFKAESCFQTQPVLMNRFEKDRFLNPVIFPNKLVDLQGCPLKISTWHIPPFVANYRNKRFPAFNATGFEMITITVISRLMNFSLALDWISYNKNQSPEGILLEKVCYSEKKIIDLRCDFDVCCPFQLKSRETNITLGIIRRTALRDQIVTSVFTTYSVPIIPLVLRKMLLAESIGIWTFPFDYITWTLMIVCNIVTAIVRALQTKDTKKGIFDTFGIIIGGTIKKVPRKISSRVHFMTTLIGSFIFRTAYQSLLFVIFRSNLYMVPPFSLSGLAEEGYRAVATEVTSYFLLQLPEIANNTLPLIITNSSSEMSPMRFMEFHRNESLVAMSTYEFTLRYVREELAHRSVIRELPIDIKEQKIGFYLPKHSFLIDCFNDYVLRLHASGLLEMWKLWTNSEYKVSEKTVSASGYNEALMINLQQIGNFFIFILICHIISIVLFVLEMLSPKCKWLQKFF